MAKHTDEEIELFAQEYAISDDQNKAYLAAKPNTNASASDIDILQNAGYRVDAPPSNPFIRDRINSVNSLLAHGRMSVNIERCKNFVQAMETQGYNDRGDPEKFNSHPAIDDWVDGAGYCISRLFPVRAALTKGIKFG